MNFFVNKTRPDASANSGINKINNAGICCLVKQNLSLRHPSVVHPSLDNVFFFFFP